jgi:hypothetical protein
MAYFDGRIHGWNDSKGYHAGEPHTATYCDACAPEAIPLPELGKDGRKGSRHWGTGFKWAPHYGGPCKECGRAC